MIGLIQQVWSVSSFPTVCHNEQGQAMVEYILVVATLIAIILSTLPLYSGPLSELYRLIYVTFEAITVQLAL